VGKVWIRMGMMLSVGGTKGIKGRYDPFDGVFVLLEPVLVLGRDGCIGLWVCVVEHWVRQCAGIWAFCVLCREGGALRRDLFVYPTV